MLTYAHVCSRMLTYVAGYGLAVSQGQYPLKDVIEKLKSQGKSVTLAIHPVIHPHACSRIVTYTDVC